MQTAPITSEALSYGIQLWRLNCLYHDGRDYRFSRTHKAVEPGQRGKIAITVNRALKSRFAHPGELREAACSEGNLYIMPSNISELSGLLPQGSTVYTVVVHESRTHATCRLLVLAVVRGEIISVTAAASGIPGLALQFGQLVVNAPRENAGAGVVGILAKLLHGDPRALRHQSLGEAQ